MVGKHVALLDEIRQPHSGAYHRLWYILIRRWRHYRAISGDYRRIIGAIDHPLYDSPHN